MSCFSEFLAMFVWKPNFHKLHDKEDDLKSMQDAYDDKVKKENDVLIDMGSAFNRLTGQAQAIGTELDLHNQELHSTTSSNRYLQNRIFSTK